VDWVHGPTGPSGLPPSGVPVPVPVGGPPPAPPAPPLPTATAVAQAPPMAAGSSRRTVRPIKPRRRGNLFIHHPPCTLVRLHHRSLPGRIGVQPHVVAAPEPAHAGERVPAEPQGTRVRVALVAGHDVVRAGETP